MRPKHILRRILSETNLGAKHQVYVRARKVKLNLRMEKDFFLSWNSGRLREISRDYLKAIFHPSLN